MADQEGVNTGEDSPGSDSPPNEAAKEAVPYIRFKEVNDTAQREREARIRAEERLKALEERPPKEPETKVFTRADLKQMVEDGKINQEQMDDYLERKLRHEIREEVSRDLTTVEAQRDKVNRIKTEMGRYKELIPDVLKEGTEDRQKVSAEYNYLVSLGHQENVQTELTALRAVYGPLESLEKRKMSRQERESFQDGAGGGDVHSKEPDALKSLPKRYKDHYNRQIESGLYSGWDDPKIKREVDRLRSKDPDAFERRAKKYA